AGAAIAAATAVSASSADFIAAARRALLFIVMGGPRKQLWNRGFEQTTPERKRHSCESDYEQGGTRMIHARPEKEWHGTGVARFLPGVWLAILRWMQ
ncbi:MAG: hypothetical protein SXG53_17610, partial [Pseudomonadota bacterium]|nr:hypothetical protein [Pseudomonadota bacterium]